MRLDLFIRGNDAVQQHVASERGKNALTAVSPTARRAVRQEILPQIEESVISADSAEELCEDTKRAIEAAFSYKNELYTRLSSYKGIELSDEQFKEDLLLVMDEWLRSTTATLRGDSSEETSAKEPQRRQVEVTVKMDAVVGGEPQAVTVKVEAAEADSKESDESNEEIVIHDASSEEQIPLSFDDIFDLRDVRV